MELPGAEAAVAADVVKRVEVVTGVVGDDVETRVEMVKRVDLVNSVEKRASEIPTAERRSTLNEPIGESYTSSESAVLQSEGEVSLEGTQTIGGNCSHHTLLPPGETAVGSMRIQLIVQNLNVFSLWKDAS